MSQSDAEAMCFIRRGSNLWAADRHADEGIAKIKDGDRVLVTVRRPRNLDHHRKLFALLRLTVENTDRWADETILLEDLKLATGLFETRISALTGMPYPVAASISFAAMSQTRFDEWYAKAARVLSDHLGTDVESLLAEVDREIGQSALRAARAA